MYEMRMKYFVGITMGKAWRDKCLDNEIIEGYDLYSYFLKMLVNKRNMYLFQINKRFAYLTPCNIFGFIPCLVSNYENVV